MKFRTAVVIIFLVIFAGLALGGSILALIAYGIGWLVNRVMKLDPFQATLIALLSMTVFGILAERVWSAVIATPPWIGEDENEDEDEYEGVGPDDRCPCGSGRKFKNCHGSKRTKRKFEAV